MVLQEAQAPVTRPTCCHHWMIEQANGPVSLGFCQFCFETREFKNSIDDWYIDDLPGERKILDPVLED